MRRHEKNNRGYMGVAILAVLGIFFVLHLALPEATLWPIALVSLAVVTMVISHLQRGNRTSRHLVRSSNDSQQ